VSRKIVYAKEFRLPIRENRCLIPADYFIIVNGDKGWLFFHEDRSTLALGGVYDFWSNPDNARDENMGCSILTIPAYGFFRKLGLDEVPLLIHHRSKRWIRKQAHLNDVTEMIQLYPERLINGYMIDATKILTRLNTKEIAGPISRYFKKRENVINRQYRKETVFKPKKPGEDGSWGDMQLRIN
jgi:putative SOS response-associated peptidase YedK